jgi:translation initiation factor 1
MADSENQRLVYSTGLGRTPLCKRCHEPVENCRCPQERATTAARSDSVVRIELDRKHRRGKAMTVVTGAPGDDAELAQVCRALKKLLATGGTAQAGRLEFQGDHRDRIAAYFEERGMKTRRVGG